MRLSGKVALVTGGARGIGAGIARCLAADGAAVGIVDIDGPEAEKTAAGLGVRALGLAADVSDEAECARAVERVARELGGLDAMINNAGAGTGREAPAELAAPGFENQTGAAWDAMIRNNLRTAFVGSKTAIPHIAARGGGSIVNIASIAGLQATPQLPAYGAAKAAVIHLTRTLALELAPRNIRANAICPGFLWTRAWEGLASLIKLGVPAYRDLSAREVFLRRSAPRRSARARADARGHRPARRVPRERRRPQHHRPGDQGGRGHHARRTALSVLPR